MNTSLQISWVRTALLLGGLALFSSRSDAQDPSSASSTLSLWNGASAPGVFDSSLPPTPTSRVPRLRLFRMAPGFLSDPLGMQEDDYDLPGVAKMPSPTLDNSDGPSWLQLGMGTDNPYFDLRRPGDPGGVGYYRVNTQVALLDSPTTSCAVGLQAVTPSGIQFAGMPDGPTVFSPAFSVFHALTDRLALQGFVSKNVPVGGSDGAVLFQRNLPFGSADNVSALRRNLQYGLALQRPLLPDGPEGLRNLFFSVGALGKLSPEHDSLKLVPNYDVLPGIQWHVNDSWWLSSAVLVPLGSARPAPGQWQLTCSLRY
jgi:hypothetical protein